MSLTSKRRQHQRIRSLPLLVNLMLKASSFPSKVSTRRNMRIESTLRLLPHHHRPPSTIIKERSMPALELSNPFLHPNQQRTLRLNKSKDLAVAKVTCMHWQHDSASCSRSTLICNILLHMKISGSVSFVNMRAYSEVRRMLLCASMRSKIAANGNDLLRSDASSRRPNSRGGRARSRRRMQQKPPTQLRSSLSTTRIMISNRSTKWTTISTKAMTTTPYLCLSLHLKRQPSKRCRARMIEEEERVGQAQDRQD